MRNKSVFVLAQAHVPRGCNKKAEAILIGLCKHPTCQPELHMRFQNNGLRQTLKAAGIVHALQETLGWTPDTIKPYARCSLPACQVTKDYYHPLLVQLHLMFYKHTSSVLTPDPCWQKKPQRFEPICFGYTQLRGSDLYTRVCVCVLGGVQRTKLIHRGSKCSL